MKTELLVISYLIFCFMLSPRETNSQVLEGGITSVTKPADYYPGGYVYLGQPAPFYDNINNVHLSGLNGIKALSTAVEQRGANTGRIWIAAAVSNSSDRDTVYYFRSDDGGISWILNHFYYMGNSDEVNFDQMDIEIIEDFSGDKYIWTVYGLTAVNGKKFTGANIFRTPSFSSGGFAFAWPGENFSNITQSRFRPRIVSDNARYNAGATVYLVVSCDTSSQSSHAGYIRYAYCSNPYTTTPAITYIGIHAQLLIATPAMTDIQPDIAYVNFNNNGYLILTYSNVYNSTETIYTQTLETDFTGLPSTSLTGGNNYSKEYACVAASGGGNQPTAMIVYRENYQNSGDWDLKALKTTNAGQTWNDVIIDTRRDNNYVPSVPDINAVRFRENRFYIAYSILGPSNFDTVKYVFTDGVNPGLFFRSVNHISGFARPKAGYRLVNNDSCFVVWSQKTGSNSGNNIWSSGGCTGNITIGIHNTGEEIPSHFALEQNYPNPFNPVTNIKFKVPVSGFVQLKVFNSIGQEVDVLVSQVLQPGTYKADFNAGSLPSGVYYYKLTTGDYSDTKKMILIK